MTLGIFEDANTANPIGALDSSVQLAGLGIGDAARPRHRIIRALLGQLPGKMKRRVFLL